MGEDFGEKSEGNVLLLSGKPGTFCLTLLGGEILEEY